MVRVIAVDATIHRQGLLQHGRCSVVLSLGSEYYAELSFCYRDLFCGFERRE